MVLAESTVNRTVIDSGNAFDRAVIDVEGEGLHSLRIDTFQVNVGLKCNLACVHCHVSSSPRRKEMMTWETMEMILAAMRTTDCSLLDITGGAPELNPELPRFIEAARAQNAVSQVRTNLTVLLEDGMEHMPEFFRRNEVRLVASLPCYLEQNVDRQRGDGVYKGSIEALRLLNRLGYGIEPSLPLHLIYNPLGPSLPPRQESLEADYRRELRERFGVHFTGLYTLTNMPIGRFQSDLRRQNKDKEYMRLLRESFNPATLDGLMCRNQVSVDWTGTLYDCDFNLALKYPVNHGAPTHIRDFDAAMFARRRIRTAEHCFGCTAGCGSSCGGALVR